MNGQEQEDEVFEGASSAEYWMYDSRTGRRFENDPLVYEYQSPYVTFNNNPIFFADPLGLEGTSNKGTGDKKGDGAKVDNHKQVKKNQRKAKRLAWFQRHGMFKGKRGFNKTHDQKTHKNRIGTAAMKVKGFFRKVFTGAKRNLSLIPQGSWSNEWHDFPTMTLEHGEKSHVYNLFDKTNGILKDGGDRLIDTKLHTQRQNWFQFSKTTVDRLTDEKKWDGINTNLNWWTPQHSEGELESETRSSFIPGKGLVFLKSFYEAATFSPNMGIWQIINGIVGKIHEGLIPTKRAHSAVLRVNNHYSINGKIDYTLSVRVKTWSLKPFKERGWVWRLFHSVNKTHSSK